MYDSAPFSKERKGADPPPNLIYHTRYVKTISGIPYTMSNSCLAHGFRKDAPGRTSATVYRVAGYIM